MAKCVFIPGKKEAVRVSDDEARKLVEKSGARYISKGEYQRITSGQIDAPAS